MAYELETIENKITENISLAASENISFDIPEFLKQLDCECLKVKKAFKQQVVSFENDNLVKRYFHFHQESLIDLINSVQTNETDGALAESIIMRLTSLLGYLEDHFPEYFDLDMAMPQASKAIVKNELTSFLQTICEKLQNTKIDFGLIGLLKNTVATYLENRAVISFREFYFLKSLRMNLLSFRGDENTETLDLLRLLMHQNFNSDSVYQYLIKYISWSVNKAQSISEKLDELAFYLKFCHQEGSISNLSFNHNSASISIQLAEWISQEMQYLKHKQQLAPYSMNAEDAVSSEFKLSFDLSVPLLAFLFRAFTETGVIQNKNTSELIRFLTKYVRTKRSESISYESFRIKYYSVESGTKDAVKKMLQTVLNFINNN